MIELADAKTYLRVDGNAEDSFIAGLVTASNCYMQGAISGYTTLYAADTAFAQQADMLRYAYIAECYRNRDASNDARANDKHLGYMFYSQITQLQNWVIS